MPSTTRASPAQSGITTSENGERHIPASTRPDGTVRKEIRVRPGYRPPEDVEVYKNRTAQAWKTRGKHGVPGAEFVGHGELKPTQLKAKKADGPTICDSALAKTDDEATSNIQETMDPETEKEREAKRLSKKLRQARALQQRNDNGDILLPEQFEKVIRINELIRRLDSIGFDAEGQRKP